MKIKEVQEALELELGIYESMEDAECVFLLNNLPGVYGPCAGQVYEIDNVLSKFHDVLVPVYVCEAHEDVWNGRASDTEEVASDLGLNID